MVGDAWTSKSPVVRLTSAAPPLLLLVGPVWRTMTGRSIGVTAAVACVLLALSWMGFVAWRVAMNAHRHGGLYGDTR